MRAKKTPLSLEAAIYAVGDEFDNRVAAWARSIRRNGPKWGTMTANQRDWWRRRYVAVHPEE